MTGEIALGDCNRGSYRVFEWEAETWKDREEG
jgi:hypothetical protein